MQSSGTRQGIVVGGLMLLFGALMLVETFYELSAWFWVVVLVGSGLGVLGVYATARTDTWMLIVSYVLLVIGAMLALITLDLLEDSFIAVYVLSVIAIPFIVGYLRTERKNWGLLIPAYVLFAVGGMLLLLETELLTDDTVPAYVLMAVALPFLIVFVLNTKQWWALIVGGIMALVGLAFLIGSNLAEYVLPAALILVGGGILVRLITRREAPEVPESPPSES